MDVLIRGDENMFNSKLLMSLIFGLMAFALLFMVAGCDTTEEEFDAIDPEEEVDAADPEDVDAVDEPEEKADEEEQISGELAFMLPPTAGNLTASPDGEYLLFTMPAAPIDPYHIINTETYEGEICDDRGIYWGEIEGLPTPGLELTQVDVPHFSPDGEKLLYVGYEIYEYEKVNAVIYLSNLGLPPEVFQQVDLSSDELIQGIRPAWKADQKGIYYLTAKGVMSYSSEEQQAEKVHSVRDLNGLVQDEKLAPHSIYVEVNFALLAYYYDGRLKMVDIENGEPELEVFDTGVSDIENIEFIFDGRYIAMESAYMYDVEGNWLEFYDRQTGELVELENNYLPSMYSKTDQGEMVFNKVDEIKDSGLVLTPVLLNNKLEKVQSLDLPPDVFLIGHMWCVLGSNQDGYPVYKLDFE